MSAIRSARLSPSVARDLPLARKMSEGRRLFAEYHRRARTGYGLDALFDSAAEYDSLLYRYTGHRLAAARVFEIGFGARPQRQMLLHSMGVDARGVDAEVPVITGSPREFLAMVRRNSLERAVKSLLRHIFFDRREGRALAATFCGHGLVPRLDASRLIVSDAAELNLPSASLDLIVSEDVFEHLPRTTLTRLVPMMAKWLRPTGLALIRPNVFTGIAGGHLAEWSRASLVRPPRSRRSEPWEHLRKRRLAANTYLNEMTRAEYRVAFSTHFEILDELVANPDLGREYFDQRVRRELSNWPEEELFSNQTLFILRPRRN
jgi:Methyltransferase domain